MLKIHALKIDPSILGFQGFFSAVEILLHSFQHAWHTFVLYHNA